MKAKTKVEEAWALIAPMQLTNQERKDLSDLLRKPVYRVVYRDKDGKIDIRENLDVERISDVWGIEFDGLKIKRTEQSLNWYEAMNISEKCGERLFTTEEMLKIYYNREGINRALSELQKNGVQKVSLLQSKKYAFYWTDKRVDCYDAECVHFFDGATDEDSKKLNAAVRVSLL